MQKHLAAWLGLELEPCDVCYLGQQKHCLRHLSWAPKINGNKLLDLDLKRRVSAKQGSQSSARASQLACRRMGYGGSDTGRASFRGGGSSTSGRLCCLPCRQHICWCSCWCWLLLLLARELKAVQQQKRTAAP